MDKGLDAYSGQTRAGSWKKAWWLPSLVFGGIFLLVMGGSWMAVRDFGDANQGYSLESARASLNRSSPGDPSRAMAPAPDFTFTLLDGKKLTLSDLRGKVVVLNFWASWCPPCRAEAPALEKAWEAYRDRGVAFLGVDIQDTEQDARAFLKEYGITYPNGQDTSSDIARNYGITGIPETFFIIREGKVARHWIGALEEKQLAGFIDELLQ